MGTEAINMSVTAGLYLLLALGTYALYRDLFYSMFEKGRMIRRLRARRREMRDKGEAEKKFHQALYTAFGRALTPVEFISLVAAMFLTVFFITSRHMGLFTALITSVMTASFPVLLLWIKVCGVKRRGSFEGERLVAEFLREYRVNSFNVYQTLEKVIQSSADIKVTRKLLSRLLYNLRDAGNPEEIKKATDGFACGIGTNWSLMLAHDICVTAEKGTNISLAVEDILIQLREARTMAEERKRLNSEAARMTFYLVPLIYCATVLMSVKYLEVPIGKFVQNQFYTGEGLILFLTMAFLFVCNIALIQLVINQRFDY